jgi:hypothetical protein
VFRCRFRQKHSPNTLLSADVIGRIRDSCYEDRVENVGDAEQRSTVNESTRVAVVSDVASELSSVLTALLCRELARAHAQERAERGLHGLHLLCRKGKEGRVGRAPAVVPVGSCLEPSAPRPHGPVKDRRIY